MARRPSESVAIVVLLFAVCISLLVNALLLIGRAQNSALQRPGVQDFSNSAHEISTNNPLSTVDDLKLAHPYAGSWWNIDRQNLKYVFCEETMPTFGISHIVFRGWVYRDYKNQWEQIFEINTHGVGAASLEIDQDSGSVRVLGSANNQLRGTTVFEFDLDATVP